MTPRDPSYRDLLEQWKSGAFAPVYLLAGPDALQKEDALRELRKRFLPPDNPDLHMDRFDGESAGAGAVINAVQTLPFFGGRRLVLVRRAHEMSAAEAGRLADSVGRVPAGNCLVLLWDAKADARSVLIQSIRSAAGVVTTFWTPFENQLPRWIMDRALIAGKAISPEAASVLLDFVGPNTSDLAQELEKLGLYVKNRPRIEASDVRAMGGGNRTLQYMEWERALWARDRAGALDLLETLKSHGHPPEALMAQAAKAYQKLCLGKALLADRNSSKEALWDRLWIKSRDLQEAFMEAASAMTWERMLEVLEDLAETERSLKTGRMDADVGMTLLVSRLTGP